MAKDEKQKDGFVIKDRRRFDSSGVEKDTEQASAKATKGQDVQKRSEPAPVQEDSAPASSQAEYAEINFNSFVMSLATQALLQLGEINPPKGVDIKVDHEAAKHSIDILGMLEVKTKGNLDPEEKNLLEEVLHNLRLSYVKVSR